jgi:hypothetical protein
MNDVIEQLDKALATATRYDDPYVLYQFKPFSDDFYHLLRSNLPDEKHYYEFDHPDSMRPDGSNSRLILSFRERLDALPEPQRTFWKELNTVLRSKELCDIVKKYHAPEYGDLHAVPMLQKDKLGYTIKVHPDWVRKAITMQFYLPSDDSLRQYGTEIYRTKTEKVRTLDFLPNTGYSFKVSHNTWHAVSPIGNVVRDSMMLIYYFEEWEEK